jgi:hypothetical protein
MPENAAAGLLQIVKTTKHNFPTTNNPKHRTQNPELTTIFVYSDSKKAF